MVEPAGLVGVFAAPSAAAEAARALRSAKYQVRAAMPAPFPEVMDAVGRPPSKLGLVTIGGAALGGALGLWLAIGTSLAWPLRVGGKPIVSLPAFLVIVFESAVLIGALANFLGLAFLAVRARRTHPVPTDPRFSRDRIGLFVPGAPDAAAEDLLWKSGAEEVRRVA